MKSTAKAAALSRDLADKLSKRYAGSSSINSVRQTTDSNGWPMLFLSNAGSEVEGAAVIAIRISGVDAVSKDVFGNATTAYAPHILEVAYELTATANKAIPLLADVAIANFEAIKTGVRYQLKQIANGTAVTAAAMDAASASADLEELNWPGKSV